MEIPSCFIKLDSLDSKFVLNGNFDHENTLPLWDFNAKNRNNFREFQVLVQKRKHEETVDAVSAKSANNADIECKTYKCNMCDIDVPTMYRREHIKSTIHRLNIEIADLVLQRIRTNLTLDVDDIADVKDDSTYFCDTCGTSVYVTEKKEHELTKMHVKLFVYEKFLTDFLDVYRNRESLNTVNFDYLAQSGNCVDVNTSSDVDDSDFERSNVDDSELAKTEIDDSQLERSELDDYEIASSEDDYEDVLIDNPNYDYAKIAVDRLNLYKVNIPHSSSHIDEPAQVVEPNIGTTVQNGEAKKKRKRVRTKKKTEKGIESKNDKLKRYYEILTRNMEKSSYKFSFENSDTVHITTMDKCVLQVSFDNFNGFYHKVGAMNYTQCRICRVMIDGSKYDHMFTDGHVEKMRIPLENKHCYRQIDVKYKHCVLCNETFFDIKYHKLMQPHKSALQNASSPYISSEASTPEVIVKDPILAKTNGDTAKQKDTLHSKDTKTSCQPCKLPGPSMVKDPSLPKTNGDSKTQQETFNSTDTQTSDQPCKLSGSSKVKDASVPKTNGDAKTQQETFHSTNTKTSEQPSKLPGPSIVVGDVKTQQDTLRLKDIKTYCQPCKLHVDVHNYPSHAAGKKHQLNAKEFAKEVQRCPPVESLHHHLQPLDERTVRCAVCDSNVPNNDHNTREHINGAAHRRNYTELLAANQIKRDNNTLTCEVCNVELGPTHELNHIRKPKHANALKQTEAGTYTCSLCAVTIDDTDRYDHDKSIVHTMNGVQLEVLLLLGLDLIHRHYEISNDDFLRCAVCQIDVAKVDGKTHLSTESHSTNYGNFLNEHRLKKVDNKTMFCAWCAEEFDIGDEITHAFSASHDLIKSGVVSPSVEAQTPYMCAVCCKYVPNNPANIREHKMGSIHKSNLILKGKAGPSTS